MDGPFPSSAHPSTLRPPLPSPTPTAPSSTTRPPALPSSPSPTHTAGRSGVGSEEEMVSMSRRQGPCRRAGRVRLHPVANRKFWVELGRSRAGRLVQHPITIDDVTMCDDGDASDVRLAVGEESSTGGDDDLPLEDGDAAGVIAWAIGKGFSLPGIHAECTENVSRFRLDLASCNTAISDEEDKLRRLSDTAPDRVSIVEELNKLCEIRGSLENSIQRFTAFAAAARDAGRSENEGEGDRSTGQPHSPNHSPSLPAPRLAVRPPPQPSTTVVADGEDDEDDHPWDAADATEMISENITGGWSEAGIFAETGKRIWKCRGDLELCNRAIPVVQTKLRLLSESDSQRDTTENQLSSLFKHRSFLEIEMQKFMSVAAELGRREEEREEAERREGEGVCGGGRNVEEWTRDELAVVSRLNNHVFVAQRALDRREINVNLGSGAVACFDEVDFGQYFKNTTLTAESMTDFAGIADLDIVKEGNRCFHVHLGFLKNVDPFLLGIYFRKKAQSMKAARVGLRDTELRILLPGADAQAAAVDGIFDTVILPQKSIDSDILQYVTAFSARIVVIGLTDDIAVTVKNVQIYDPPVVCLDTFFLGQRGGHFTALQLREETSDAVVQALRNNGETRDKTAPACSQERFEAWVVRYKLTAERQFGVVQLDASLPSAAEVIARTTAEEVARAAADEVARAAAAEAAQQMLAENAAAQRTRRRVADAAAHRRVRARDQPNDSQIARFSNFSQFLFSITSFFFQEKTGRYC